MTESDGRQGRLLPPRAKGVENTKKEAVPISSFVLGIIWATASKADDQYVVRNADRFFADQVQTALGGTVYTLVHPRNHVLLYCVKIPMAVAPFLNALEWTGRSDSERAMPSVDDPAEFCRAYIQCHAAIDERKRKTTSGGIIATPRLRIYASEAMAASIMRVLASAVGVGEKTTQRTATNEGVTFTLYYQSPREVRVIYNWICAGAHSPRFTAAWQFNKEM